jgi:hypothetical protein
VSTSALACRQVPELRALLESKGLDASGLKADLIKRLLAA